MAEPATPQAHDPRLAHQFDSLEQQHDAAHLGMWVFLVTEVLFFGGLFLCYLIYRYWYPLAFQQASHLLDVRLGAFNTAVLISSSLTMALAVRGAQLGERKTLMVFLVFTILLGLVFLGVKSVEYHAKFVEHLLPGHNFEFEASEKLTAQIFFSLYFMMTGLHALHMIIGIGIMLVILWMAWKGRFDEHYSNPVEVSGLYWHFVDIMWIFLFPLLYLIDRHP